MLLRITLLCVGTYWLVGAVAMSIEWQQFRACVFATEPNPNATLPPPWACWILGSFLWGVAAIASAFDKNRSE